MSTFVWIVEVTAAAVAFGIAYWSALKFHRWWARLIVFVIALVGGGGAYLVVGYLSIVAGELLGLIDLPRQGEHDPQAVALGQNGSKAIGAIVAMSVGGILSAALSLSKRAKGTS